MPVLYLVTNVLLEDPKAFVLEFSKRASEWLDKPEEYVSVDMRYNETLCFAGTFDPAFLLNIISLGNISPEQNADYCKDFFDFLSEHLGVLSDRGYVHFIDPGRDYLGHMGKTFAERFGKE